MERPQVNIYIETSKKGPSRGKGVYGAIIEYETTKGPATLTIFKQLENTTENQAELEAAVDALKHLTKPCYVTIYTGCTYFIHAMLGWLLQWAKNDWINAKGKTLANVELWKKIYDEQGRHIITIGEQTRNEYQPWLRAEIERRRRK